MNLSLSAVKPNTGDVKGRALFQVAMLMMFSGIYDTLTIGELKRRLFDQADKEAVEEFEKIISKG